MKDVLCVTFFHTDSVPFRLELEGHARPEFEALLGAHSLFLSLGTNDVSFFLYVSERASVSVRVRGSVRP